MAPCVRLTKSGISDKRPPGWESARQRIAAAKFKPVLMFNRDGDFVAEFPSVKAAAEYLSVSLSRVSCVLTGRNKTTAGYTFRYKENPDQ